MLLVLNTGEPETAWNALRLGHAFSCTTCLKIRGSEGPQTCPMSSMDDLALLTEEADRVLTFG